MMAIVLESIRLHQGAHAVSETVADECIIINLENGNYHRTLGPASTLWEQLKQPVNFQDWLTHAQGISPDLSKETLAQFAIELLDHGLLAVEPDAAAQIRALVTSERPLERTLRLETYDDMADLLLLDPIHEVSEQGWPHRPAAA